MEILITPFEYSLADDAINSARTLTHNSEAIFYRQDQISKQKTKTLVFVYPESKKLNFMIPIVKGDKFYGAHLPDPVLLYFSLALKMESEVAKLKNEVDDYIVMRYNEKRPDEIKVIDRNLYNSYIQMIISTIVFLHMSLESFINSIIPDNFEYNGQSKEIIENSFSLNEKITKILSKAFSINFHIDNPKNYSDLDALIKLRNELVHLKTGKRNGYDAFIEPFEKILNFNCKKHIDSVYIFINMFKHDYIKYK